MIRSSDYIRATTSVKPKINNTEAIHGKNRMTPNSWTIAIMLQGFCPARIGALRSRFRYHLICKNLSYVWHTNLNMHYFCDFHLTAILITIFQMILLAKDYVHYLKRYSKSVTDGKDFDAVIKASETDLNDAPKCSQLLVSLKEDLRCATSM